MSKRGWILGLLLAVFVLSACGGVSEKDAEARAAAAVQEALQNERLKDLEEDAERQGGGAPPPTDLVEVGQPLNQLYGLLQRARDEQRPVYAREARAFFYYLNGTQSVEGQTGCNPADSPVGDVWLFEGTKPQDGRANQCAVSITLHEFLTTNGSPWQSKSFAFFPLGGQEFTSSMFRHPESPVSVHCRYGYQGLHGQVGLDELYWGINALAADILDKNVPRNCMIVEWFGATHGDALLQRAEAQQAWVSLRWSLERN